MTATVFREFYPSSSHAISMENPSRATFRSLRDSRMKFEIGFDHLGHGTAR